jgi:hypothetical protein
MKRIVEFKKFESRIHQLEKSDLEEIFIDLIDEDYLLTVYGEGKLDRLHPKEQGGYFYFDLRKQFSEAFDFDNKTLSYGCRDIDSMHAEIEKVFTVLRDAKDRLNSMGYNIGFEPEFQFSEDTLFCITCHVAHSNIKQEDDEDIDY